MDKYQIYNFENNDYYLINDIHDFCKPFFRGCRNNVKNIIVRKNIDDKDIYRAHQKNKQWVKSKENYNRAKLFLSKDWVHQNVPNAHPESNIVADVEDLPPKVILDDTQQFTDGEHVYPITIRGKREFDGCYFRVKDIEKLFEIKSLSRNLSDKRTTYEKNVDYKIFIYTKNDAVVKNSNTKNSSTKKSSNKNIRVKYFTYNGLIKCLYISKSDHAHKFREWANKILFTHQFGSKDEKIELFNKSLGHDAKSFRETLKVTSKPVSCVYLFTLGTVNDLRHVMNIDDKYPDNYIICKYGFTDNLARRTNEHINTFNKFKNVDLRIKWFSHIDSAYISKAECNIKNYFNDIDANFKFKDFVELVILDPNKINSTVKEQFQNMQSNYIGHAKDFIIREERYQTDIIVQKLKFENDMLEKNNKLDMALKDNELLKKDNELLKKDNELLKKDKELLEFKIKYLELKNESK